MVLTRIKEDVTAINLDIFKRAGLSVKFKVKTYTENANKQQVYYHNEYVYNKNNKWNKTLSLSPKSYIQLGVGEDEKYLIFIFETFRNKIIRKLSKLVALLEAYESNEIDIVKVDSSGTHISNNFPKTVNVIFGKNKIDVTVVIREDKGDVGVVITFDGIHSVLLSLLDFLDLYYKLKDISYLSLTMQLITYLGSPELGRHEKDFRNPGVFENARFNEPVDINMNNPMNAFDSIKEPRENKSVNNRSIKW